MSKSRTPAQASEARIDAADRASKHTRPAAKFGGIFGDESLMLVWEREVRDVSLPEPVDAGWLSWRPAAGWEAEFITEARHGERRAELALLAGLLV